jgi:hypothetical protein
METPYSWRVRINESRSANDLIGDRLRALATQIDGRHSVAIAIETVPELSAADEAACLRHGFAKICWAVSESARAAAQEAVVELAMIELEKLRAKAKGGV